MVLVGYNKQTTIPGNDLEAVSDIRSKCEDYDLNLNITGMKIYVSLELDNPSTSTTEVNIKIKEKSSLKLEFRYRKINPCIFYSREITAEI